MRLGAAVNRRSLLTGTLGGISTLALAACQEAEPLPTPDAPSSAPASPSESGGPTSSAPPSSAPPNPTPSVTTREASPSPATAAEVTARATVPVLCYHQLRDWTSADSEYSRNLLICPPATFRAQLDALAEDGWTTIRAEDYYAHLTEGSPLPAKPVLLTFDDSQGSQKTEAFPQLTARGMTATFFAMTVPLGKDGWLSPDDLKEFHLNGMTIAAHTWDHHRVDKYSGDDWKRQLEEPRETLEKIIGEPVEHFAYPYGAWNEEALPQVASAGYKSAYQLADRTPSQGQPLLTLRRSLVNSTWDGRQLLEHLAGLTD